MISKLMAGVLLAVAFGYALWLHIFRKPLPDVTARRGWRRGFFWATVVFAAWMGTAHSGERPPDVWCYDMVDITADLAKTDPAAKPGLSEAVRAAWLSLDGNRGEELRLALEREVAVRGMSLDAAKLLRIAFRETAYHYYLARGGVMGLSCYRMSWEGYTLQKTREYLLTRMEFLADARRKGQIDKETYNKVAAEIAHALAAFDAIDALDPRDYSPQGSEKRQQTVDAIRDKTIPVDAAATEAAAALADMAANAPEGWAAEYRWGEKKEKGSDLTKPGVWQPPPPLSRDQGGF